MNYGRCGGTEALKYLGVVVSQSEIRRVVFISLEEWSSCGKLLCFVFT